MADIENKIVSISFNNKQFMDDVADTIEAIEKLNKATSGSNIDTSGLDGLRRAFQNATKSVTDDASNVTTALENINAVSNIDFKTGGIDALRKALENAGMTATDVEDTIAELQQISKSGESYASNLGIGVSDAAQLMRDESSNTRSSIIQDIDDISNEFNLMSAIATGAMIAIGEKAVEIGQSMFNYLTRGIRDGWGEYNSITNSTQTILSNTQRWGSTINDVTGALDELNEYADLTTYAFSDMTRNIGYFTTAGVNLEDSVTAIQGLSNAGALFGADAQAVARAGYQMSQAMSAGVIKLMDWRSMVNAGMGGQVLQDELIRTAAVMSGTSIDAMNEYIEAQGGFNQSLQNGWLTADVFLETMKTFAGQTREYYEQLTDASGNRLYTDEQIDELVRLGETAMESATKVRTFQQMMDAFGESIGSGWSQTFRYIIGNLEEAKEFWTPINDILTNLVSKFFELQNGALETWRTLGGRDELLVGLHNVLQSISDVLTAIGTGFSRAFGGVIRIGPRLMGITEAFTDFSETLLLSEDELEDLSDFFQGLFEPISLVVDVIFELVKAFFDAGDSALNLEHTADGIREGTTNFRKSLLLVLGTIGRILKAGAKFLRENEVVKKAIQFLVKIITKGFGLITKVISAPFILLYQVWEKYNISEKLEEFWVKVATYFLPIIDVVNEVKDVFTNWFNTVKTTVGGVVSSVGGPLAILEETFGAVRQLFRDLFDPTVSISDAFGNFASTLSEGKLATVIESIKTVLADLWNQLMDTPIGQWFEDTKTKIQNAWEGFLDSPIAGWIEDVSTKLKEFLGLDTMTWDSFWSTLESVVTTVADNVEAGWTKIKTFFGELIDIVKDWFGLSDEAEESTADAMESIGGAMGDNVLEGQIAQLPGILGVAGKAAMQFSDDMEYAEEHTPDPERSRFLEFLSSIPERITNLVQAISDNIVSKLVNGITGLITPILEFFSDNFAFERTDMLTWLSDRLENLKDVLYVIIGIPVKGYEGVKGIIRWLAELIAEFINAFGGISKEAIANLQSIVNMIIGFMLVWSQLKVAETALTFAQGLRAAGKGWQLAQRATNNLAKAAKWTAIAKALTSVALLIAAIFGVVLLMAYMIKHDYGPEIWTSLAVVVAILGVMIGFIFALTNKASELDKKSKVLTSVSKMISSISGLLLMVVASIAGLLAIAFAVTYVMDHGIVDAGMFKRTILTISVVALLIIGVISGLIYVLVESISKNSATLQENTFNQLASLVSAISRILVGITIFVAGILAAIAVFTVFIEHTMRDKNNLYALIGAVSMVALIVVGAVLVVRYLIGIANKVSSETSKIDSKKFASVILLLSGLLLVITASALLLIAGMTFMVSQMNNSGINAIPAFLSAAAVVSITMGSIFLGLTLLLSQIKSLNDTQLTNMKKGLAAMINFLVEIMIGIAMSMGILSWASQWVTDFRTLLVGLAAMAILLPEFIGMAKWLLYIVQHEINGKSITTSRIENLKKALGAVLVVITILTASIAGISIAIGYFNPSTGSLITAMASLALMTAGVIGITVYLAKMATAGTIDTTELGRIGFGLLGASLSVFIIASALSMMIAVSNNSNFGNAAMALGGLFVVMSIALGLLASIADMSPGTMVAAAGSMGLAALAFLVIASALAVICSIDKEQLTTAGLILGGLFFIMTLMIGILTSISMVGQGIGAIVILAVAAALVLASSSFLIFANAIKTTAEGINLFVAALERLQNIDTERLMNGIRAMLSVGPEFIDAVIDSLNRLARSIGQVSTSIVSNFIIGFANGMAQGIPYICQLIIAYAPMVGEAMSVLGLALLGSLQVQVVAFCAMIRQDFGPGGIVRDLANNIGDFVTWLAGKASGWAVDIVEAVITGLAESISDGNTATRILLAIEILYLSIKQGIMEALGVPNFTALGASIALKIMTGIIEGLRELMNGWGSEVIALLDLAGIDINGAFAELEGTLLSASNIAWDDAFDAGSLDDDIDGLVTRMNELGSEGEETAGVFGTIRNMVNEMRESAGFATDSSEGLFDTIIRGVRDVLGISDDFSITDLLGDFSLDGLLGDSFDIGSITDNLGGLTDSIGSIGSIDTSSILNFDTSSLDATNLELGEIADSANYLEDCNPVITPDVDLTNVEAARYSIEDMFNDADIGSFAIDAGNSVLIGRGDDVGAATDAGTTVQYTQINNYPPNASPIQIYRDTNAQLRGRFDGRISSSQVY